MSLSVVIFNLKELKEFGDLMSLLVIVIMANIIIIMNSEHLAIIFLIPGSTTLGVLLYPITLGSA